MVDKTTDTNNSKCYRQYEVLKFTMYNVYLLATMVDNILKVFLRQNIFSNISQKKKKIKKYLIEFSCYKFWPKIEFLKNLEIWKII